MLKLLKSRKTTAEINRIIKEDVSESEENKILRRINSLLSRKDIVDLDNDKIDALRLLTFHLESNKEMSATKLVKFLKL